MTMELEGELYKEFKSFREALDYLARYPYGTIEHPDMSELAFLYMKNNGQLAFLDADYPYKGELSRVPVFRDAILPEDILNAFNDPNVWDQKEFFYRPGSEMAQRLDGVDWFDGLRADFPGSTPLLG